MKPDTCKLKYRIVFIKRQEDSLWCPPNKDGYYIVEERVRGLFRYKWKTVWFMTKNGNYDFRIESEACAKYLLEKYKEPKEVVVYQE